MAETVRGDCSVCGREGAVTADGGLRHHFTEDPEKQAGPDSRKCRGVGLPPAGAQEAEAAGHICRVCSHPVHLTSNGRARSHLSVLDDKPCAGGSDWPLAVDGRGNRTDTAPDPRDAVVTRTVETIGAPPIPDEDPVECACNLSWAFAGAMRAAGHDDTDCDRAPMVPPASQDAADADNLVLDVTHPCTDASGTAWVHPGTAADCRLPECCTHPRGFVYGDDDNGHSGSVCRDCGAEEPDPGPEDRIADMPEETTVGDLDAGDCFRRHRAKAPLDRLVYQAGVPSMGPLAVTVVSAGPHHGRTGHLINLTEEVTCTDEHGTPRARRDRPQAPASGVTSPTGPAPFPPPTPSPAAPAASSTRTAPVTDAFQTAKAAVSESEKYDNYGRYKLLHPDTGKKVKWTRATTFAKSVQDTFALSMWSQRMTLKGAALRDDIVAAVSTLDVKQDKDRVNALVEDAKKAAGDKVAANKGTAIHAFTEDRDRALVGMPVKDRPVPEEFVPTVEAYTEILAAFGLEPVAGLIEFTTAVKQYEVAGTGDRVYRVTRDITVQLNGRSVTLYAGEYVIGDVKSGADLSYGWQEIAIQLSLYAQGVNTSGVWSWGHGTWGKPVLPDNPDVLLKVRTDVGLVPHLPVDRTATGAPLATLYAVDLDAGWTAAVLCASVRTWRKTRKLATPLEVADVVGGAAAKPREAVQRPVSRPVVASRPVTLEDKARAITSRAEASAVFQEAKAARVPVTEINRLTEIMQRKLESFVEQGS